MPCISILLKPQVGETAPRVAEEQFTNRSLRLCSWPEFKKAGSAPHRTFCLGWGSLEDLNLEVRLWGKTLLRVPEKGNGSKTQHTPSCSGTSFIDKENTRARHEASHRSCKAQVRGRHLRAWLWSEPTSELHTSGFPEGGSHTEQHATHTAHCVPFPPTTISSTPTYLQGLRTLRAPVPVLAIQGGQEASQT